MPWQPCNVVGPALVLAVLGQQGAGSTVLARNLRATPIEAARAIAEQVEEAAEKGPSRAAVISHNVEDEEAGGLRGFEPPEVADSLKDAKDKWSAGWDDRQKKLHKGEDVHKPLMKSIDVMRADMCWTRPDFWSHEKCLKFLGMHCSKGSTGHGLCKKFGKMAEKHCAKADTGLEDEICKHLEQMKIVDGNQEKEKKDKEEKEKKDKEAKENKESKAEEVKAKESEEEKDKADEEELAGDVADFDKDGIPDDEDPDIDNDGVANKDDAFPKNKEDWGDLDGDGIGDNKDNDKDGDGVANEKDAFPDDPSETKDLDKDGIGDNVDEDRDGDGHDNDADDHPDDPRRNGDRDGDGVKDSKDAFPDDPKETADLDGDGIGDNSDKDIDGDDVPNESDEDPRDPTKGWKDVDGDGHFDKDDAFPNDPTEWKDSDKDGMGDNADAYPDDPNCQKDPCSKQGSSKQGGVVDEDDVAFKMNKVEKKLPPDGYDEYTPGLVEHDDMKTHTKDWGKEWPNSEESRRGSLKRICEEEPDNIWCKRYGYSQ